MLFLEIYCRWCRVSFGWADLTGVPSCPICSRQFIGSVLPINDQLSFYCQTDNLYFGSVLAEKASCLVCGASQLQMRSSDERRN